MNKMILKYPPPAPSKRGTVFASKYCFKNNTLYKIWKH